MDNGQWIIDNGQRFAGRTDIFVPGNGRDVAGSGGYRQLPGVGKELRVESFHYIWSRRIFFSEERRY
jgi:hypothetical protein